MLDSHLKLALAVVNECGLSCQSWDDDTVALSLTISGGKSDDPGSQYEASVDLAPEQIKQLRDFLSLVMMRQWWKSAPRNS